MINLVKLTLTLLVILQITQSQIIYPVLMIHGLSNACDAAKSKLMVEQLQLGLGKNIYVRCLEPGAYLESFTTGLDFQIKKVCKDLNDDENFQGDISIIGVSQGGLIGRAIIENCDFNGQVKRFVSVGGPQQGVASCPICFTGPKCLPLNMIVQKYAYTPYSQENIGPAAYVNLPKKQQDYLAYNTILPYLNNQKNPSQQFKQRIENLDLMLLVRFSQDEVVNPNQSEWFYSFDEKMKGLISMQEQPFYEDLGLKTLNDKKSIRLLTIDAKHTVYTNEQIQQYFVPALAGLNIPDTISPDEAALEIQQFNQNLIVDKWMKNFN